MTDRKDALTELLAKVEAGIEPNTDDVWDSFVESNSFVRSSCLKILPAFHGSLDAAKALHEAVLPEWTRSVDATAPEMGIEVALHGPKSIFKGDHQPTEARAWLIAILKALIADA
jgi:hypothetical protein